MTVERWTSQRARALVSRVLAREVPVHSVVEAGAESWARDLLLQWLRNLWRRRSARPGAGEIARAADQAVEELAVFARNATPASGILHRLDHPGFGGSRQALVATLADDWGGELRRWRRRSGRPPDLRGAKLDGLILGHLPLEGA